MENASIAAVGLLQVLIDQGSLHIFNQSVAAELIARRFATFDGPRLVPTDAGRIFARSREDHEMPPAVRAAPYTNGH